MRGCGVEYSEIGLWSEAKLDIIEYAFAYSMILTKQEIFTHIYVDAFAGPGLHHAKLTSHLVAGSPLNALEVEPTFAEYHFIDLDNKRVRALEKIAADYADVQPYHGDSNRILVEKLFPNLDYKKLPASIVPAGSLRAGSRLGSDQDGQRDRHSQDLPELPCSRHEP